MLRSVIHALVPLRVRRPIGIGVFEGRAAIGRLGHKTLGRLPLLAARERVYDDEYYETIDREAGRAYERLVDTLIGLRAPKSVLDVGCGTGLMLRRFAERGADVRGIEGSSAAARRSGLGDRIVRANLERGVPDLGSFDLCVCIEVAEHLSPRAGPHLVAGLVRSSDFVVFSAAPPGQAGTAHINSRPRTYWLELFAGHGFRVSDANAEVLAALEDIEEPEYLQANLVVLERS